MKRLLKAPVNGCWQDPTFFLISPSFYISLSIALSHHLYFSQFLTIFLAYSLSSFLTISHWYLYRFSVYNTFSQTLSSIEGELQIRNFTTTVSSMIVVFSFPAGLWSDDFLKASHQFLFFNLRVWQNNWKSSQLYCNLIAEKHESNSEKNCMKHRKTGRNEESKQLDSLLKG